MRYELNQRLRTHSCGQDLTLSRLARAESEEKKSLKGSEKPLKSVFSGRNWGSDSVFGSWGLIDCRSRVPDGLYKCLRFQCIVLGPRCKDLSERLLTAALRVSRSPDAVVWDDILALILHVVEASCWPNNPSETDGKQIKKRPNTRIHLDHITLTLRLFNEPCTDPLICPLLPCYYLQPASP